MNEKARTIVRALRHLGKPVDVALADCSSCPMQDYPHTMAVECGENCPGVLMLMAADLIEKLSAQLANQATEYSQALKITTEQRDMLMGTQDKLAALLSYVTGGRFSKTSYSIDEMERFVDDYQQSECAKCDELEQVKVERDAVPQWISVEERLPSGFDYFEDGTVEPAEYIVKVKGASVATIAMFDGKEWIPAQYNGITEDRWFASSITHWMPLPEAPKGERHEK